VKYIKWRIDWNRPLSSEEREIARRLECAPDETDYAAANRAFTPALNAASENTLQAATQGWGKPASLHSGAQRDLEEQD
jgi:hypothetical protein